MLDIFYYFIFCIHSYVNDLKMNLLVALSNGGMRGPGSVLSHCAWYCSNHLRKVVYYVLNKGIGEKLRLYCKIVFFCNGGANLSPP